MVDFFNRNEILTVLQGFNPWWQGQTLTVPDFHRVAYQICRQYLRDPNIHRAVLLSGPRRVGKTTILTQMAQSLLVEKDDPKSIVYLSLDHPLLKLLSLPEILRIYHESIHPEGQPVTLLLDEVQYSKEWELQLKQLIDHKPQYRILATGSASVVHRRDLSESGVGRWIRVPIPTLSFFEFLQIRRETIPNIPATLRPMDLFSMGQGEFTQIATLFRSLMPLFQRYLLVGGFPETARQTQIALCQRLLREDVVERVLKRDMTALFGIRNVADLERLFIYLCIHSGGIFAVKTCADALAVSPTTIANYLEALEQANLIYRLTPAEAGGKKVLKLRHKVYLVDAALRNAVLLHGEEILSHPDEMGVIVETTVLRHLYAYYYRDIPAIMYWRDAVSGKEVDVIVKSPTYQIPVEVKYRQEASLSEKDGLVEYVRDRHLKTAYLVTQRDLDFDVWQMANLSAKFLRIPAHIFIYLLGQAERLLWSDDTRPC